MVDLSVKIKKIIFKNPVLTASGTFGSGCEYNELYNIGQLGGIITKATSFKPLKGNPPPRIIETPSGMLNAIGLQNKGVDNFVDNELKKLQDIDTNIIVNIAGHSLEDYVECAKKINKLARISGIELNISCPNVKEGGMSFGTNPKTVEKVVATVRKHVDKLLIVKLSPNVTSIVDIAKAAINGGADALSLINTLSGMAIDIHQRKPVLANISGGLSGSAVKPVALKMVWDVAHAFPKVPIIGIGGIVTWQDAVEFLIAGACAVEIGTANFIDPLAPLKIIKGLENYLTEHKITLPELRCIG
jgi:dihydroorotate dehydrogenase (NAD+) catalytic subunit